MTSYSTQNVSRELIEEIKKSLKSIKAFGSLEIYVQNGIVSQLTIRKIKKTREVISNSNNKEG